MDAITENFGMFVDGYLTSLGICLAGAVGSLLLGTILAAFRVSPVGPLRGFAAGYVNVVRNCPLTVMLFMFAFGLPEIGVLGSYWWFGVSALIVYTAAFVCEAVRGGINTISLGQVEAARSIGLSFGGTLRHIILPQALASCIPPVASVLIAMFKNSAIVGAFGVGGDLFSVGESLTSAQGYAALPVLTGVAVGYLAITLPAAAGFAALEQKVAVKR